MLERNPAPGTEGEPPRRSRYDLRTGAFEVIPVILWGCNAADS